ncbi:hypothetical protein CMK16_02745 [Candidatus Poribacteria bacterium]|nr:hypothetical protein [Candidatus Poribacteria bacterium]
MTGLEKFLFDLWGYVVIDDVLTQEEIDAANEATDHHTELIANREPGLSHDSDKLKAEKGRGEFRKKPLTFDNPWCIPFRRMLTHPRIIDIFNEILGRGFRLDHGPGLIQMEQGTEGHWLHGGMTFDPSQYQRLN